MMRKAYLWLLPLGVLLLLIAAVQALPGYVSSPAHRAQMEAFASAQTGRPVRIVGDLSLGLFPLEVSASGITISGPDNERITAQSLTMDLSLGALLRGQPAAQNLTLQAPHIALPWPLPGGPAAVEPPPLLAALHAVVNNGTLDLNGLAVSGISADIFTGPGGAFSVSGTGTAEGLPVSVTLALSPPDLTGTAPLSLDLSSAASSFHMDGTLSASGAVTGQSHFSAPGGVTGTAQIVAIGQSVAAPTFTLQAGPGTLTGTATLALQPLSLTATLSGESLDLDTMPAPGLYATPFPTHLALVANAVTLGGQIYPSLSADLTSASSGTVLRALALSLPGGGALSGNGTLASDGTLAGDASLAVPDVTGFLAAYALPPLPAWTSAHLTAQLTGQPGALTLRNLTGTLGPDHLTGTLILTPGHAAGALNFDHLALAPLSAWLNQRPASGYTADAEITAASASAGPVPLSHFVLDGELDGTLNVRRISASLYGGLAAGSFTLDSSGQVTSAHGFLDIPSATPLAKLLPVALPPAALAPRLTLSLAARGPANALATSAVLTLGLFTVTAAPVIDLTHMSAAGALTLRHPNAVLALQTLGLPADIHFPGAGSAALRASFIASATSWGLPDFSLSLGALTATGTLVSSNGVLNGDIAADTLALPALPAGFQFPPLPALSGKILLSANRVLYGCAPLAGPSAASLTLTPKTADIALTRAALAGGTVTASLHADLAPNLPPKFALAAQAQGLDVRQIALSVVFPYPLLSGQVSGTASLTANGYSPNIWLATLSGAAQLTASNGVVRGMSLAKLDAALGTSLPALRSALTSGTTAFSTLSVTATLTQGNAALTQVQVSSPAGSVTTQPGSYLDIYDHTLGLRLAITPAVHKPPMLTQMTLGAWAKPRHIAHLTAAVNWKP